MKKSSDYPIQNFDENGFAFCPDIARTEARKALEQIQYYWQSPSGLLQVEGNDRFKTHLFLSEINRIVHRPTLLKAVRQAPNTEYVALWSSDLNIKQPNSRQYFSAHQDATYTGLQPADKCVTVWVALSDPVGLREGCLSFLKGSHKNGQLAHVEELQTTKINTGAQQDTNLLSRGQRVLHERIEEKDDWVTIPLRAGDATLHSFYTIHQSGHNQHPTQPRVGLALRFISYFARQMGPARELITWIDNDCHDPVENKRKRQEMEKYFDLEPQLSLTPTEEEMAAGRRAHEEAMRRENSNYFLETSVKGYQK